MTRITKTRSSIVKHYLKAERTSALVERALLEAAFRAGIGPRLLRVDDEGCTLTLRKVGHPFPRHPAEEHLVALAKCLARLHRISAPAALRSRVDRILPDTLERYIAVTQALFHRLAQSVVLLPEQRVVFRAWLRAYHRALTPHLRGLSRHFRDAPKVVCHGDIKASNLRLCSSGVRLIDFEAARVADAAWELANTALAFQLTAFEEDTLLEAYLRETVSQLSFVERFFAWRMAGLVFHPLLTLDRLVRRTPGRERFRGRTAVQALPLQLDRLHRLLEVVVGAPLPSLGFERLRSRLTEG